MINKTVRMIQLYDVYGGLLTKRQQEFTRLYYEEDLSLGEIATEFNISRQAVHDILRRGGASLEEWEKRLGVVEHSLKQRQIIRKISEYLKALEKKADGDREYLSLLAEIKSQVNLLFDV